MSKTLTPDQLYQLLEEHDPGFIRQAYAESLVGNPELQAILSQFEKLDQDMQQLGALASPPEPDWQRIRTPKSGLLVAFPRYILPLAAVLILGLVIGSQYWQQGARLEQSSAPAMEQLAEPVPQSPQETSSSTNTPSSTSRQSKKVSENAPLVEEEQSADIALSDFPDMRIVAHDSSDDEASEASNGQEIRRDMQRNRESRAQNDLPPESDRDFERQGSAFEDKAKSEQPARAHGSPSALKESVPAESQWKCWQSAFLEFFRQSTLPAQIPFSDKVRISWSWLELENADLERLHAAIQSRRSAQPEGQFSIFLLQQHQQTYLVNWFWQNQGQTETGVFAMTLNENCQLTKWRELAE